MKKQRYKLLFTSVLAIGILLSGCSEKEEVKTEVKTSLVTNEEYEQLENNMTFKEVIDLLGNPTHMGSEVITSEVVYKDKLPYYWDSAEFNSFITLYFKDEKLIKKDFNKASF